MKYRNISDRTLEVAPSASAPRQVVPPDGLIEAAADDDRVWPESTWQPVTKKKEN